MYPCILTNFTDFLSIISGKRVVVFLDYDGTLTPIVSNPDEAYLSASMRLAVQKVAQTFPTAIISGRGRGKVEAFVQLQELYYAGSHGLDIKGPVVCSITHDAGITLSPPHCSLANLARLFYVQFLIMTRCILLGKLGVCPLN